eukprot:129892-Hanusia_phi.AAC.3
MIDNKKTSTTSSRYGRKGIDKFTISAVMVELLFVQVTGEYNQVINMLKDQIAKMKGNLNTDCMTYVRSKDH